MEAAVHKSTKRCVKLSTERSIFHQGDYPQVSEEKGIQQKEKVRTDLEQLRNQNNFLKVNVQIRLDPSDGHFCAGHC
jgi:endonuclease IV